MTKQFNQYTDSELLTLSNDQINDAIRIEAIERGIEPPITLSEALRRSEFRGYEKPAEAIEVFEIVGVSKYGSPEPSGIGFLNKERAQEVLNGMVCIEEETYGANKGWKVRQGDVAIASRWVGISQAKQAWSKLEEYTCDNEKFEKVVEECVERLSQVRQADYDRRVRSEKRTEYLRLAGGNEEIAKGFWSKVERTEWPVE